LAEPVIIRRNELKPPPRRLLAVDPGLTTGYALFRNGRLEDFGQCVGLDQLTEYLERITRPEIIVMEKYRLFKWLAEQQSGSRMEVAQAEGIIVSYAHRNHIKLEEQAPNVLPIAEKYTGLKVEGGSHKFSHWRSAFNHGTYYLVKKGMIEIETR